MLTYPPLPVLPRVSLLIAMRNEADYIAKCVQSALRQDYPAEHLEIFVLDGNSDDASWQIVEQLFQGRANCFLLPNPGITQSAGWNLGIRLCNGDIIGIVSAHSELAADYVSTAVETLRRSGADLVGGPARAHGESQTARAIAIATSTAFGVGGARFHYTKREEAVDTVFMGVCRKEMYQQIGGFDEEMVRDQDDELSYRLLARGGRIVCNPAIRSIYYNRSTLRSLWRQYVQYGFWKVRVLQKHLRQMRLRHFIPPIFVASLIASAALSLFSPVGWLSFIFILSAYLAANLTASAWAAGHHGWRYFPLLMIVYAILHLSYGLGFLAGLVKFAHRWR